jgi:hypothetical protein
METCYRYWETENVTKMQRSFRDDFEKLATLQDVREIEIACRCFASSDCKMCGHDMQGYFQHFTDANGGQFENL